MSRAKIGDIIEIPTPVGLVYAQFTHFHKKSKPWLRRHSKP